MNKKMQSVGALFTIKVIKGYRVLSYSMSLILIMIVAGIVIFSAHYTTMELLINISVFVFFAYVYYYGSLELEVIMNNFINKSIRDIVLED